MTRYHIGKDGNPHVCKAQEGQCPLGGEHFNELKKCEKACEERFRIRKTPFSRKKNMEKIRNLPDQVYLANYYAQYAQRASNQMGSPMVIKKDGQVYGVTEKNLITGRETFINPRKRIDFDNNSIEYRMIPLDECVKHSRELNNDDVWISSSIKNKFKNLDKLGDPVKEEAGGLKSALKTIDDKIESLGDGMDMGVGSYMRDQTRRAVNDPNNQFGQVIRRMNDRM